MQEFVCDIQYLAAHSVEPALALYCHHVQIKGFAEQSRRCSNSRRSTAGAFADYDVPYIEVSLVALAHQFQGSVNVGQPAARHGSPHWDHIGAAPVLREFLCLSIQNFVSLLEADL